jgi:hypothetical protein
MVVATREAAKAGPYYCGAPSLARRPGAGQQRTCSLSLSLVLIVASLLLLPPLVGLALFPPEACCGFLGMGTWAGRVCADV